MKTFLGLLLSGITFLFSMATLSQSLPPPPYEPIPSTELIWLLESGEELDSERPPQDLDLKLDIDLFVFPGQADSQNRNVYWTVLDINGKPLQRVTSNKGHHGFRIPAAQTHPSDRFDNMQYFDVILVAKRPGWVGQSWLGTYLDVDQNPIEIAQRIYLGNEDVAWSHTLSLPLSGALVSEDEQFVLDMGENNPPGVNLQMRDYDTTVEILRSRNPVLTFSMPRPEASGTGSPSLSPVNGGNHGGALPNADGVALLLMGTLLMADPAATTTVVEPSYDYVHSYSYTN